jgi:hypothetical protein
VTIPQVEGLFHFIPPPDSRPFGVEEDVPGLPPWVTSVPPEGWVPANGALEVELRFCVDGGPEGAAARVTGGGGGDLDAIVICRVRGWEVWGRGRGEEGVGGRDQEWFVWGKG